MGGEGGGDYIKKMNMQQNLQPNTVTRHTICCVFRGFSTQPSVTITVIKYGIQLTPCCQPTLWQEYFMRDQIKGRLYCYYIPARPRQPHILTSTPPVASHPSSSANRTWVVALMWMAPGRDDASMRCAVFIESLHVHRSSRKKISTDEHCSTLSSVLCACVHQTLMCHA